MATATVTYRGQERTIADLAREHHIDRRTLQSRLDRGMPIEEALREPPRSYPPDVKRTKAACDRCGRMGSLSPCGLVPFLMLCGSCRNRAADVVRRWVGSDA